MIFPVILFAALGAAPLAPQDQALTCMNGAADQLAADPKQVAELRRWTRWEATRLLWSMAGDSPKCSDLFKTVRVSDETSNAAYRHADDLVTSKHLYRGSNASN